MAWVLPPPFFPVLRQSHTIIATSSVDTAILPQNGVSMFRCWLRTHCTARVVSRHSHLSTSRIQLPSHCHNQPSLTMGAWMGRGKNQAPFLLRSPLAYCKQFAASLIFGLTGPAVGPEDLFQRNQGRGGSGYNCLPECARASHTLVECMVGIVPELPVLRRVTQGVPIQCCSMLEPIYVWDARTLWQAPQGGTGWWSRSSVSHCHIISYHIIMP